LANSNRLEDSDHRASPLAICLRGGCPSGIKNHSAEFIAQAVGRFRILLVAETFGQGKKLLLLSLLCVNAVLDQFQQHLILAQLSILGHAV
jgi:hypothetical protein